jgi:two-component system, OmpR family, sensor histidine kinase KdpD
LLAGVLEAIGAEADRVDVTLPTEVPALLVDGAQIERALANIVGNALKFSQGGGRVGVSVETLGEEIVTRVEDSGPGVYGELERLFLPFQTGGGRLNGSGPGLGLAIARGFTELNGGRVWCERSPKGGASFAVAFPKARKEVSIACAERRCSSSTTNGRSSARSR